SYARNIVASKFLTFDFGSESLLKRFAFGLVLMNTGYLDKAIEHFERFLKAFGNQAVNLLTEALRLQSKTAYLYVKRAQIQFLIGNYAQAFNDMSNAINMNRTAWQLVLQRCLVNFALAKARQLF
uniref:TPR_REGION domain-containing protein n=1 Tax=Macrostomum lignano TaxID=282301 RepID=A0A1I8JC85_9PLAT